MARVVTLYLTKILLSVGQGVSTSLSTGATRCITKEDALLQDDINQDHFDMLLANLRMDSVFVKENMKIKWASETGIVENLPKIVKEFRESRKLTVRYTKLRLKLLVSLFAFLPTSKFELIIEHKIV